MRTRNTKPLGEIVEEAHTEPKTVRVFAPGGSDEFRTIESHLSKHDVDFVRESPDRRRDESTVRVERDGRVLAESSLRTLARFVREASTTNPMVNQVPAVLEHLDNTRFQSYDKRRMILASRLGEFRAHNKGSGELHAGFQKLSKIDFQRGVYLKLSNSDVETHVYGIDDQTDWSNLDLVVHANDDPEVTGHWWVAFDGDGNDDDKFALLAREITQSEWFGFWTYSPSTVDDIIDRCAALR